MSSANAELSNLQQEKKKEKNIQESEAHPASGIVYK